jgi:hypothetical protein
MSDGAAKGKEHDVPVRYLITISLFAHGVGHLLFVANSWGYWKGGEEGHSWLFSGMLGVGQAVEGIFGLLWFIPLVGFVAILGLPCPLGVVATTGTDFCGDLCGDDRPVVGKSCYGQRLLRLGVRLSGDRGGALATTLWCGSFSTVNGDIGKGTFRK